MPTPNSIEKLTVPSQERRAGINTRFASRQTIQRTHIIGHEYNDGISPSSVVSLY